MVNEKEVTGVDSPDEEEGVLSAGISHLRGLNSELECKMGAVITAKRVLNTERELPQLRDYPLIVFKSVLADAVADLCGVSSTDITIQVPPANIEADFTIMIQPLLTADLTGEEKANEKKSKNAAARQHYMNELVPKLVAELPGKLAFAVSVEQKGIFLNVKIDRRTLFNQTLASVFALGESYGSSDVNRRETIVLDFASPNTAKTMHLGHLRSTIIGQVLINLHNATGSTTFGINHLGDWGTQFGQLVVAWQLWGEDLKTEMDYEREPIKFLAELYRRMKSAIGDEENAGTAEQVGSLTNRGRQAFVALEAGQKDVYDLWQEIRRLSLIDFDKVFKRLDIKFDGVLGESFYEDKMAEPANEAIAKNLVEVSPDGGALVARIKDGAIIPAGETDSEPDAQGNPTDGSRTFLFRNSGGRSNYHTRDVAAIRDRLKRFGASKILYVVGAEQKSHFDECFALAKHLWDLEGDVCEHIDFGLFTQNGKKIASREGAGGLDDFLNELKEAAAVILRKRADRIEPEEVEELAEMIGSGSLIYANFMQGRQRDVEIDLEAMLSLTSQSGAYVQYTAVRAARLLEKLFPESTLDTATPVSDDILAKMPDSVFNALKKVAEFPEIVVRSTNQSAPHLLAGYLYELCLLLNSIYSQGQKGTLMKNLPEPEKLAYGQIVKAIRLVLTRGLSLLNIKVPDKM